MSDTLNLYMRGWEDGATVRPRMSLAGWDERHVQQYTRGFEDGRTARETAKAAATEEQRP